MAQFSLGFNSKLKIFNETESCKNEVSLYWDTFVEVYDISYEIYKIIQMLSDTAQKIIVDASKDGTTPNLGSYFTPSLYERCFI